MDYEVWVNTSEEEGSGTDSNVFFIFCGTAGKTKRLGPYTSFERGKRKKFRFSTFEKLGDISKLIMYLEKTESSTDYLWKPSIIQVLPLPDNRNHPGWTFVIHGKLNCEHGTYCYKTQRVPNGEERKEDIPKTDCSYVSSECVGSYDDAP